MDFNRITTPRSKTMSRIVIAVFCLPLALRTAQAAPHLAVDLDNGQVLSQQQAFDPWHPASLTKLMTAYTVFRAIQNGEANGTSTVRISDNARRQPPSKMGYRTGTTMSLDNALKLLLIKSANDIAVAIAESLSGSVDGFSNKMNAEAARLGMTGSRFVNPHGLHDRRQITTARDLALLITAIHREFPQYKSLFETPSVMAPSFTKKGKEIQRIYYSYNLLLERVRGADGFKTGYVCASGYNYIGAATRSGRRIAAIVLGRDSQTSRAVDAAKLIEEGFRLPVTQPLAQGVALANIKPEGAVPSGPRNMNNIICSQEARATRYEPGAGQAVITSPWLQERVVSKSPLVVTLEPPSAAPASASRIPLPSFRPATPQGTALSPTGEPESTAIAQNDPPQARESTVSNSAGAKVPLPSFRPGTL